MRFLAMVVEDDVATASVEIDGRAASFEVTSNGSDRAAVIGSAALPDPVNPAAQHGAGS